MNFYKENDSIISIDHTDLSILFYIKLESFYEKLKEISERIKKNHLSFQTKKIISMIELVRNNDWKYWDAKNYKYSKYSYNEETHKICKECGMYIMPGEDYQSRITCYNCSSGLDNRLKREKYAMEKNIFNYLNNNKYYLPKNDENTPKVIDLISKHPTISKMKKSERTFLREYYTQNKRTIELSFFRKV